MTLADDDTNLMLSEGDSHGKDCWGGDGRNLDVDGDMHEYEEEVADGVDMTEK